MAWTNLADHISCGTRLSVSSPLHLLLLEDSEDEALSLVRELSRHGYTLAWERVDTAEALQAALARGVGMWLSATIPSSVSACGRPSRFCNPAGRICLLSSFAGVPRTKPPTKSWAALLMAMSAKTTWLLCPPSSKSNCSTPRGDAAARNGMGVTTMGCFVPFFRMPLPAWPPYLQRAVFYR